MDLGLLGFIFEISLLKYSFSKKYSNRRMYYCIDKLKLIFEIDLKNARI